ncbi:hypothetical protein J7547_06900 [Wohlfahrtiimonas chitiniclastica]|uniref:Uncharacterized protein n=1 Tax=Wohlfahrtiimonas chitiniclastica TaxID=400946 RepID=A0AB35BY86_9GAMM|nr:hypothetical protein [Wohlfahrtiimonas chitiniclastica]MBS7824938.1 hypothetical protein [Wohlfahrtiimonas chitiniclastica]MBS7840547.1 hypothetical protein [Wohlfahrtiimonas chitiniclastica]
MIYRSLPSHNSIDLFDKKIRFSTISSPDLLYAFYLYHVYHQDRIEKLTYQSKSRHVFDMEIIDGLYRGVFFTKGRNKAANIAPKHCEEFFLVRKNRVVYLDNFIIREEQGYIIENYDIGSDITFIVFQVTGSNKKTAPFGLEFLLLRGYNVIACNQNNNQYQELSYDDFQDIISPYVKNKKVFLYGSSLGGYCAVYYAGAVNGTAIAAAPRNSLHPALSLKQDSTFKHTELIDKELSTQPIYIFIDPHQSKDIYYLDNHILPAYPHSTVLRFEYAGHEVLTHISRTKQLSKILDAIVRNDKDFLNNIDRTKTSEFTYVERAIKHFDELRKDISHFNELKSRHISAEKKMLKLTEQLHALIEKLDI